MEGSLLVVKREGGQGCGAEGWGDGGGEPADREGRGEEKKEEEKE